MSVSLIKGQKVSLTKENPGLSAVVVGLGWDAVKKKLFSRTNEIDCDAFAIVLKGGRLEKKRDIVYFGNLSHYTGAIRHMGDNLTGEGEGDDEQILIELDKIPAEYDKIIIAVNIFAASSRKQHFGMIENAFIRLVDAKTNKEMCIYNLTENYSGKTAMFFGEIYRYNGEWKFNAMGQGTNDDNIEEFASRFR